MKPSEAEATFVLLLTHPYPVVFIPMLVTSGSQDDSRQDGGEGEMAKYTRLLSQLSCYELLRKPHPAASPSLPGVLSPGHL